MLVVTNLVLPCVTKSNTQCYDTTHQRLRLLVVFLDFCRLVVTNLGRITDLNIRLRKLEEWLRQAKCTMMLRLSNRLKAHHWLPAPAAPAAPRGRLLRLVTVAVPTPTCKGPQKPVPAQKKGGENEQ
jgi:hypothetical protein